MIIVNIMIAYYVPTQKLLALKFKEQGVEQSYLNIIKDKARIK